MNNRMYQNRFPNFTALLNRRPRAWANVRGSMDYPDIHGMVRFYETGYGVLVVAEIAGLPTSVHPCSESIFGFHIHEDGQCDWMGAMSGENAFSHVGGHYNPYDCPHPYHAGDLPPLFGAGGYAFSAFLTDRFLVEDIIGRSVIIHLHLDDFTTQPSGNAGQKIACGEIFGR